MFVKASLVPYSTFQVPYGYCSNLQNLVSMEDLKLYALKSHDYHTLMQQLLPVSLRSILPKHHFPPSFFDIMMHFTMHFEREVRLCDQFTLGGCTHLKEEGIEFCKSTLSNVEAIGIPSTSNIDQKVGASIFGGHTMKVEVAIGNEEPVSETLKWIAHGPSHYDLDYTMFKIPIFKCDWVDNKNGIRVDDLGFTLVDFNKMAHKSNPFILAS
ncbi:hypothetical protein CK203_113377 [Vitis vinifera]|uniref:DUF4216 domain-containing protein n=1 Tax=Vitis vinifera TaxID=29760 RepID=A0A438CUN6_VITVI|nr:hypothetical protein CK203_113377 [Vitis vinifera]